MNNGRVYFPGLNGLRFIAALMVFLSHVELLKQFRGGPNIFKLHFFSVAGQAGVDLFFCISGFLITYLLLSEKGNTTKISLRDFYMRRILRIWPLYYFISIITLFIIPAFFRVKGFGLEVPTGVGSVLLFLFFSPYIAKALLGVNFLAAILWSIGVEETYYLFWPMIVKWVNPIRLKTFIFLLVVFMGVKAIATYAPYKLHNHKVLLEGLSSILGYLEFECMLIGGAFAFLYYKRLALLKYLQNAGIFFFCTLLLIVYFVWGFAPVFSHFNPIIEYLTNPVIYALLCSVMIINIIDNKAIYSVLEQRFFFEMGQISYGFYVYHSIGIMFTFILFEKMQLPDTYLWLLFLPSFFLTAAFSWVSYYGYEVRFLKLKKRFTHVLSGVEAKADTVG